MARSCFCPRACLPRPRHLLGLLMCVILTVITDAPSDSAQLVNAPAASEQTAVLELLVRPLKPPAPITCEKRRYYYFYC